MRTDLRRLTLGLAAVAISMGGLVVTAPTASAHIDCPYAPLDHQPVLRAGSRDAAAVMQLQCMIDTYSKFGQGSRFLQPDGSFGKLTRQAVVDLQTCAGIEHDGVVGPQTWRKIYDLPTTYGC